MNQDETDVDCGGMECPQCSEAKVCNNDTDCMSGVCGPNESANATCNSTDCNNTSCNSSNCVNGSNNVSYCQGEVCFKCKICTNVCCLAPTCSDGVMNEDETDVDCGGSRCPKCANTKACNNGSDCMSGICNASVCEGRFFRTS